MKLRAIPIFAVSFVIASGVLAATRTPFARFEPTPPEIVTAMLELAEVKPTDVVYDLGSGDGRVVIMAAEKFGARGVGVEINRDLVRLSQVAARKAGVSNRVRFVRKDLFDADIRAASVVTLYLLPQVNLQLRPKLLRDLKPGVRIISHNHNMGDWAPERTIEVADANGKIHRVHLWTVPSRKDQPPLAGRQ
jgi:SAM-dependent methyltransferase